MAGVATSIKNIRKLKNCWETFQSKYSRNLFYFNCVSCKLLASLRHLCLFHQKAIIWQTHHWQAAKSLWQGFEAINALALQTRISPKNSLISLSTQRPISLFSKPEKWAWILQKTVLWDLHFDQLIPACFIFLPTAISKA
jgi:hypothetical protein